MRDTRRAGLWAGLFAVLTLAGAMMASPAPAATFVYVGNAESNEVWVLPLDRPSGDLTVVEKVPIPGITKPGNSTPMAVSPDRRILYVGTRGEPKIVAGFAIDPASGRLKHLASGPLARQHGVYLHRSYRALPARRLVSGAQGHREPDRTAGDGAAGPADPARSSERARHPRRRREPARARPDAGERQVNQFDLDAPPASSRRPARRR